MLLRGTLSLRRGILVPGKIRLPIGTTVPFTIRKTTIVQYIKDRNAVYLHFIPVERGYQPRRKNYANRDF